MRLLRGLVRLVPFGLVAGACVLLLARCDAVSPVEDPLLVVEGFLDARQPLPSLVLRHTKPLAEPYEGAAVADAEVTLQVEDEVVRYRPGLPAGRYEPATEGLVVPPRAAFRLQVRWQGQQATASGSVPPPITIDSIQVEVPDRPVQAVLLDSLRLDSLSTGAGRGYIYPVQVRLWWTVDYAEVEADSAYWIRTQLKPFTSFSSTVVNFFLRPEQILRERSMPRDAMNRRSWTGIYAVPVAAETAPLPPHRLKVSLLRSGRDYARFALSRDAPERREPISNVSGAIGIVAGISVDSLQVQVE